MENQTNDKKRPEVLELTLCHKCKSDFENSDYIVVRKDWQENKESCDFCQVGKGFNYGVLRKETKNR